MKRRHNEGFSLVEVLVAIVILGIFVAPTCSSLVMAFQMNHKTDELLNAQLAVSTAVETLKAEGIEKDRDYASRFSDVDNVIVTEVPGKPYYSVTVKSGSVQVETYIRAAEMEPPETTENGEGGAPG